MIKSNNSANSLNQLNLLNVNSLKNNQIKKKYTKLDESN